MKSKIVAGQRVFVCEVCGVWGPETKLVEGKMLCKEHWRQKRLELIKRHSGELVTKGRSLGEKARDVLQQMRGQPAAKGPKNTYKVSFVLRSAIWSDKLVSVGFCCDDSKDAEAIMGAQEVLGMEVVGYCVQLRPDEAVSEYVDIAILEAHRNGHALKKG